MRASKSDKAKNWVSVSHACQYMYIAERHHKINMMLKTRIQPKCHTLMYNGYLTPNHGSPFENRSLLKAY